jgi:hypothetical protein
VCDLIITVNKGLIKQAHVLVFKKPKPEERNKKGLTKTDRVSGMENDRCSLNNNNTGREMTKKHSGQALVVYVIIFSQQSRLVGWIIQRVFMNKNPNERKMGATTHTTLQYA